MARLDPLTHPHPPHPSVAVYLVVVAESSMLTNHPTNPARAVTTALQSVRSIKSSNRMQGYKSNGTGFGNQLHRSFEPVRALPPAPSSCTPPPRSPLTTVASHLGRVIYCAAFCSDLLLSPRPGGHRKIPGRLLLAALPYIVCRGTVL